MFEMGLFVGRLGRDRNFIVLPRGQENSLHLPTDILGLATALYDPVRQDGSYPAALGPACNKIKRAISKLGTRPAAVPKAVTAKEDSGKAAPIVPNIGPSLSETELSVLVALASGHSSMRSIAGIAKESNLEKATVNVTITSLLAKG